MKLAWTGPVLHIAAFLSLGLTVTAETFTSTVIAPDGKAAVSTTFRYRDEMGYVTQEEVYVSSGDGGSNLVDRKSYVFDEFKRPVRVTGLKGLISETTWGLDRKLSETDANGVTTRYEYDALGRVVKESIDGGPIRSYTYDAMNRQLSSTVSNQDAAVSSGTEYDLAGRVTRTVDEEGRVTTYQYELGGRRELVTLPGGATRITERYLDGRLKSITGTAQEPQYFEYGVNSDGSQWTRTRSSPPGAGDDGEKTTTDMLGRTVQSERPEPAGVVTSRFVHDRSGRVVHQSQPGMADTIHEYDEWGYPTRSGLDMDADGKLDPARDRVVGGDQRYRQSGDGIWQTTESHRPSAIGGAAMTTNWSHRERVAGFGPGVVNESVSVDAFGNEVRTETMVNRPERTMTRTTTYGSSGQSLVEVYSNRLLRKRIDVTGHVVLFTYDGLERVTGVTDQRLGTTRTHYDSKGRIDFVEDAAGHRTSFQYDPATGRKIAEIDALGGETRCAYDLQGHLTHVWGSGTTPMQCVHDEYGQIAERRTYRGGSEWSGPAWPDVTGLTADETRYEHDAATGLLTNTIDAAGIETACLYTPAGQPAGTVRPGAGTSSPPVLSSRTYDPRSGELLSIDYSDSTPDIHFTYNRAGRLLTVLDAAGCRSFTYTPEGLLCDESMSAPSPSVISRVYSSVGFAGRPIGFALSQPGSTNVTHSIALDYDSAGRCNKLRWDQGPVTWTWFFVPGGGPVQQCLNDRRQWVSYEYEPHRDLCTRAWHLSGTSTVSSLEYAYDALGRATQRIDHLGGDPVTNTFAFSPRGELVEAIIGSNIFRYSYDNSGYLVRRCTDSAGEEFFNVDALGQCTRVSNLSQGQTPRDLTYDRAGRLARDGSWSYTWDAEDRLVSMTPLQPARDAVRLRFTYDYLGQRIRKEIDRYRKGQWIPAGEHRFVYKDRELVKEEIVGHRDKSSATSTVFYVWGPEGTDPHGAPALLCAIRPASTVFYIRDVEGNITGLVDADSGAVIARYAFGPLGEPLPGHGEATDANPFRYRTLYADTETGLLCDGKRYFATSLGRWLDARHGSADGPPPF